MLAWLLVAQNDNQDIDWLKRYSGGGAGTKQKKNVDINPGGKKKGKMILQYVNLFIKDFFMEFISILIKFSTLVYFVTTAALE